MMKKTVLVVEDNTVHANLIKDLLETKDIDAVFASSGAEARAMAFEHCPDLIIMDMQLPDVSGLEVTKTFKAEEKLQNIPIIAVTAFASKEDEGTMRTAGCIKFIRKPFSMPEFLETVSEFLR